MPLRLGVISVTVLSDQLEATFVTASRKKHGAVQLEHTVWYGLHHFYRVTGLDTTDRQFLDNLWVRAPHVCLGDLKWGWPTLLLVYMQSR